VLVSVYDKGSSRYRIFFDRSRSTVQYTRAEKENEIGSGPMPYLILYLPWVVSTASKHKRVSSLLTGFGVCVTRRAY